MEGKRWYSEIPHGINEASRAYDAAQRGEQLSHLRLRMTEETLEARTLAIITAAGIASAVALYLMGWQKDGTDDGYKLLFVLCAMLTMFIVPYLVPHLWRLRRIRPLIRANEGRERTREEEAELGNALSRLAAVVHHNHLLLHLCRARYDAYEALRDSGRIARDPKERNVADGIDRVEAEILEETRAVNGLMVKAPYLNAVELTPMVEAIAQRSDLKMLGLRLQRLLEIDPTDYDKLFVRTNDYKADQDPEIDQIPRVLAWRLTNPATA